MIVSLLLPLRSTDGRYIGMVLILWLFPVSSQILIVAPKWMAVYRVNRGIVVKNRRGSHEGVRVTGMDGSSGNGPGSRFDMDQFDESASRMYRTPAASSDAVEITFETEQKSKAEGSVSAQKMTEGT